MTGIDLEHNLRMRIVDILREGDSLIDNPDVKYAQVSSAIVKVVKQYNKALAKGNDFMYIGD
jgi:hypothetical protein